MALARTLLHDKWVSLRLTKKLLNQLTKMAQDHGIGRATYMRIILEYGVKNDPLK